MQVFHSLMPKGVEHNIWMPVMQQYGAVFHSLMPKGVEHIINDGTANARWSVFHSLMPKGVEHSSDLSAMIFCTISVSFVDAERR